ncbi:MAG: alpha/beta fold hydrolase [Lachnospiraceae bacterium]|nr:alpha/beta fold hydrolase [Lachnospiraceae bacterium]
MSKASGLIRNITILTGLSVAAIHVINRIETGSACSEKPVRTREDKTYNWRYGIIDYKVKGYGSPLLLLHDLTIGSSKSEYKYIYDELSKNKKVFIPDLLGYGISDKPVMTYTASTYEDLVTDFIKNVIKIKTDIIATGATAPIVIKLAHDNPKLIRNIIMINPLGLYDQNLIPSTQTKLLKILINIPVIGTFIYNMMSNRSSIEELFIKDYLADPDSFDTERLNDIVSDYYRAAHERGVFSKHAYASYLSQYMTCSILSELQETDHSMLIIGGEAEPNITDNIENYNYYNSAIESVIISGTSHLPQIERPEEIISNVEVFLSNE